MADGLIIEGIDEHGKKRWIVHFDSTALMCHEVFCNTKEAATALSMLIKRAAAMEWQPMATAPKDGASVLLYDPRYREAGACCVFKGFWDRYPSSHGLWARDGDDVALTPTRWMPLPTPPETNDAPTR